MPRYNLSEISAQVLQQLDSNIALYPLSEIDAAVNESVKTLNLYCGFLQADVPILGGTISDRVFYDVPESLVYPTAVAVNSAPLTRSSLRSMALRRRNWMSERSVDYGAPQVWIPIGIRKIALWPGDSLGGRTMTISGISEPVKLVNPLDIVQVPEEIQDSVQSYAMHTLQLKEGGKIFSDASVAYQDFLREMKSVMRWQRMKNPTYFVEKEQSKNP